MKKILFHLAMFIVTLQLTAQNVTITETKGWLESAYVKWTATAGADSYNVYYTGGGLTNIKLDTQLIRNYGSYYRADAPGLASGNYTLKVVPVTGGVEGTSVTSQSVTVLAHDRNGFAHSGTNIPGAYNLNGTLKTNAVILYITQNTKNTISLNVTGATTNPCVGLQTILDGFKKGLDDRPLCIRLIGNITDLSYMMNGDLVIENKNNIDGSITFEGIGSDAIANGWGLRIKNGTNIEVRNLGFMLTNASEGDNVGLQQDNDHIWVHNCDMFYGAPGGDADQAKGDGALDCKKSTYVTFSYNHFWDSGKSNLLGLSENTTTDLYITYHHNWYDHSDSRHPRVRFYSAHIYNNYFDGNSKYGSGSTEGSSLFVEGNVFRNCKYPMLTSMQGSDIAGGSEGTFSNEDGGFIKAYNNVMSGQTSFIPYNASTAPVNFDAYVANTRSETVSSNITSQQGNNAYNNFDNNASLYVKNLVIEEPLIAKDNVLLYSGRVSGGDITYTFNNAVDDVSYSVNSALMALLTGYTSSLVSIQGEGTPPSGSQTLTVTNSSQSVTANTAITNMVFTWGGTATDTTVTGLPASGISFVKNTSAKTITVSGTPTTNVSFSVTTSGTTGSPVTAAGTITLQSAPTGNEIHNFTTSNLTSSFYSFVSANINSTNGSATYDGLTLTKRLKIESSTKINYTTSAVSTLTLVMDPTFNGTIKLNGVAYTASSGIVVIPSVPAGANQITKGTTTNLFYIKTVYNTTTLKTASEAKNNQSITVFPNPATKNINISLPYEVKAEQVIIYNSIGQKVKSFTAIENLDISDLSNGTYLVKIFTDQGIIDKRIIKQ